VNSKGLFCFETPFTADDEANHIVHAEFGQGEGACILDAGVESNSSGTVPVSVVSVETTELQTESNGTILTMSNHQHGKLKF